MNQGTLRLFELYETRGFMVHRVKRTYLINIPRVLPILATMRHTVVWRSYKGIWVPFPTPTMIAMVYLQHQEEPYKKIQVLIFITSDVTTKVVIETEYETLTYDDIKNLLNSVLPWNRRILSYCYTSALEVATSVPFDPRPLLNRKAQQGILDGPYEKSGKTFYIIELDGTRYIIVVYKGEEYDRWKVEAIFLTKYEDSAGQFAIFNEPTRNERKVIGDLKFILEFVLSDEDTETIAYEYFIRHSLVPKLKEDKSLRQQLKQIVKYGEAKGRKLVPYGAIFVSGYQYIALHNTWMLKALKKALKMNLRGGPSPISLIKNRKLYLKLQMHYKILDLVLQKVADARSRRRFSPWICRNWHLVLSVLSRARDELAKLLSEVEKEMKRKGDKSAKLIDFLVREVVEEKRREIARAKEKHERREAVRDLSTATRDGAQGGSGNGDGTSTGGGLGTSPEIQPASSLLSNSNSNEELKLEEKEPESPLFELIKPKYQELIKEVSDSPEAKKIVEMSMELAREGNPKAALSELNRLGVIPLSPKALQLLDELRKDLRFAISEQRKRFEQILEEAEKLFHQGDIEGARKLLLENKDLANTYTQWRKLNGFLRLIRCVRNGVGQGAEVGRYTGPQGSEGVPVGDRASVQAREDLDTHGVLEGHSVQDEAELLSASGGGHLGTPSVDNSGYDIVGQEQGGEASEGKEGGEGGVARGHKEVSPRVLGSYAVGSGSCGTLQKHYRKSEIRAEVLERLEQVARICPVEVQEKIRKLKDIVFLNPEESIKVIHEIEREYIPTKARIIFAQIKYLLSLLKKDAP